jgi:hypothetical protein
MIAVVARALGPDLLKKVAFVGGCTTGLLLTVEICGAPESPMKHKYVVSTKS